MFQLTLIILFMPLLYFQSMTVPSDNDSDVSQSGLVTSSAEMKLVLVTSNAGESTEFITSLSGNYTDQPESRGL